MPQSKGPTQNIHTQARIFLLVDLRDFFSDLFYFFFINISRKTVKLVW